MLETFASEPFVRWLDGVVQDEVTETRWLNLLSQLEYVGCRKILKSIPYERVNASVLQHIQEEALHAHLLKQLVLKRGGKDAWEDPSWSESGWEYIQSVDRQICEGLSPVMYYPLVSWVIEQRVMWLYPWYLEKTSDPAIKRVLTTILAQEKRHADQFAEHGFNSENQLEAVRIEERAWNKLIVKLSAGDDLFETPYDGYSATH
ncbi:MAG: ferritin-like domain-containing protein [Bdellovibrionales bacterium]|nr:ferritin-like domain-containing protein [Bdellovibrionales bacterium]